MRTHAASTPRPRAHGRERLLEDVCASARTSTREARTGHSTGRRARASLARNALVLVVALLSGASARAQQSKPDLVFVIEGKSGPVKPVSGVIKEHKLSGVVVEAQGKKETYAAQRVVRIQFGDSPPSFQEGQAYMERGEYAAAADAFEVATAQTTAREVVRAAARLSLAEAQLRAGSKDPSAFALAREQATRFLEENPDDLGAPRAKQVLARSLLLSGDAAEAAKHYAELFGQAPNGAPKAGYDVGSCMRAGLGALRASLRAGDTLAARETRDQLQRAVDAALASTGDKGENAELRAELEAVRQEVRLAEGQLQLASKDNAGARSFFEQALSEATASEANLRFGARLGLAEALLAQGETRRAQLEFGTVASIDPTDRDRAARALVGLTECAQKLSDEGAVPQTRIWLQTVVDHYGDTPSARRARELLEKL